MSGKVQTLPQEQAQWLFEEGAILVFLDVPAGTEFGIDYNSWKVGPKFRGVKMIPPGIHFIYYSAVNIKHQEVAPRTGFFHNFSQREILIKKWNSQTEDICSEDASEEEQERVEQNKRELDRYLGAYPYDSYKKWISLTSHISTHVLEKLTPDNKKISSVAQLQSKPSDSASRREEAMARMETNQSADSGLPDLPAVEGSEIKFSNIPKKKHPDGATPAEITKYSMDHSHCLQNLIELNYKDNPNEILGEVQCAFVCFLVGQVFEAFEQWKKLVHLLSSCEEALETKPDLYMNFISLLYYHVQEIPEDFFVDIVEADNFLVSSMRKLFENLSDSKCSEELLQKGLKFKKHLEKKYKWDLSAEADEYAPVVVP